MRQVSWARGVRGPQSAPGRTSSTLRLAKLRKAEPKAVPLSTTGATSCKGGDGIGIGIYGHVMLCWEKQSSLWGQAKHNVQ